MAEAKRNRIYSLRKGSVQWNEEDRLALANMLVKAGYAVRIGRREAPNSTQKEYFVEYWEDAT